MARSRLLMPYGDAMHHTAVRAHAIATQKSEEDGVITWTPRDGIAATWDVRVRARLGAVPPDADAAAAFASALAGGWQWVGETGSVTTLRVSGATLCGAALELSLTGTGEVCDRDVCDSSVGVSVQPFPAGSLACVWCVPERTVWAVVGTAPPTTLLDPGASPLRAARMRCWVTPSQRATTSSSHCVSCASCAEHVMRDDAERLCARMALGRALLLIEPTMPSEDVVAAATVTASLPEDGTPVELRLALGVPCAALMLELESGEWGGLRLPQSPLAGAVVSGRVGPCEFALAAWDSVDLEECRLAKEDDDGGKTAFRLELMRGAMLRPTWRLDLRLVLLPEPSLSFARWRAMAKLCL